MTKKVKCDTVEKTVPKYKNYRVCYEHGDPVNGQEIYELHKTCTCSACKTRVQLNKRHNPNCATATTKDLTKVDEVAEFLNNWTCENGNKWLPTVYFQF